MNRQITFVHNDVKLFSIIGSSYLASQFPNTNAISQSDLFQKPSYQTEFSSINSGKNYRSTLLIENANITKQDSYYLVTGEVTIDGELYVVELGPSSLVFNKKNASVPMPDIEPVEEDILEEIIEEPEPEPIPEPEPEPIPDIEPLEEADIFEEILEDSEPQVQTPAPKNKSNGLSLGKTIPTGLSIGNIAKTPGNSSYTHRLEFKEKNTPVCGIVFGERTTNQSEELRMGINASSTSGISFGKREVPKNSNRKNIRNEILRQQAIQLQADKEKENNEEEKLDTERLQNSWKQSIPPKLKYDAMQPTPTELVADIPEPPKEDIPRTARDEAKANVRKDLPDDINKVIGDIPIELLDSCIPEFTMDPVNTVELLSGKDMFCIDRRWHKQGKWFCIDVVANNTRYFYNSRLGVNIEIPIKILKSWKEALSA